MRARISVCVTLFALAAYALPVVSAAETQNGTSSGAPETNDAPQSTYSGYSDEEKSRLDSKYDPETNTWASIDVEDVYAEMEALTGKMEKMLLKMEEAGDSIQHSDEDRQTLLQKLLEIQNSVESLTDGAEGGGEKYFSAYSDGGGRGASPSAWQPNAVGKTVDQSQQSRNYTVVGLSIAVALLALLCVGLSILLCIVLSNTGILSRHSRTSHRPFSDHEMGSGNLESSPLYSSGAMEMTPAHAGGNAQQQSQAGRQEYIAGGSGRVPDHGLTNTIDEATARARTRRNDTASAGAASSPSTSVQQTEEDETAMPCATYAVDEKNERNLENGI